MKVRAYLRCSTDKQVDKFGLPAQKTEIKAWIKANHPKLDVCWYSDKGVSGTIPFDEREEGKRLISEVKEGDIIISAFASRYSRKLWISAKFLDDMDNKGAIVMLPVIGNCHENVMYLVESYQAEGQRTAMLKATSAGREEKRKIGGDIGGTPKAWQMRIKDEGLFDDPEKISLISKVSEMLKTKCPYQDIVDATGVKKPTISNWSKQLKIKNSEMNEVINANNKRKG